MTFKQLKAAATLLLALALGLTDCAAPTDRYFDTVPAEHGGVRLTVFYPSIGTVRDVAALREVGFLDIPDLTVVGVFHVKETSNYEAAKTFVQDEGYDWFKFHAVDAPIGPDDLFRRNACTAEFETIVRKSDGVIFFGGPDIPPSVYGRKTSLLTEIDDPFRHYFEVSAVFHLLGGSQDPGFMPLLASRPDFPVFGICLGFQTLNVGTGGTLIQDIWTEIYFKTTVEELLPLGHELWHTSPFARLRPDIRNLIRYSFHSLDLAPEGMLCRTLGFAGSDHPRILSAHHQAVDKPGRGWRISAVSRDGKVIEAMEHIVFANVLGVQFHPEHARLWDGSLEFIETPDAETTTSYRAILENAPPSWEFHRKIWEWYGAALRRSAAGR
ncbi:MAG: gamma-glutamyl-gamma-aminobutyrate hydrolase family protein [Candidatus Aminicenantes bacterium]|nr:gamma-glutamyl-gamma-aminobutyrate hydrolase family protein [Candidatus Aminicenantes bacterium]